MLERILVPLDGSALSETILWQVRRVLSRASAELALVRVVRPDELGVRVDGLGGEEVIDAARRELELRAELLVRDGARTTPHILVGEPAERILGFAATWKPSLIALATHGRSGIARWVRGSVAERVLAGSPFPLLLANPRAAEREAEPRFRSILVALDGSDASASILPLVTALARLYEARVDLFHAVETLIGPFPALAMPMRSFDEAQAAIEPHRVRLERAGVRATAQVIAGEPPLAILDAIERARPDLVALTTHGRTGPSRWLYGSVAAHVIRECRCPLLVQRTGGQPRGEA